VEIILIRHTQVDVPQGTVYGQLDVPLAKTFPAELARIRGELAPTTKCHRLFSSPLSRCRQLTSALATDFSVTPHFEPLLLEMNFGDWEGRTWQLLPQEQAREWGNLWQTQPAPGGESFQDIYARSQAFIEQHVETVPAHETLIVVAHSGLLRCLCLQLHPEYRQWDQSLAFKIPFDYGTVLRFNYG